MKVVGHGRAITEEHYLKENRLDDVANVARMVDRLSTPVSDPWGAEALVPRRSTPVSPVSDPWGAEALFPRRSTPVSRPLDAEALRQREATRRLGLSPENVWGTEHPDCAKTASWQRRRWTKTELDIIGTANYYYCSCYYPPPPPPLPSIGEYYQKLLVTCREQKLPEEKFLVRVAKKIKDAIVSDPKNRPFFMYRHIMDSGRLRAGLDAYLKRLRPQISRKRKGV